MITVPAMAIRRLTIASGKRSAIDESCSGPKPESYPRTYPNPRISEYDPGPDPLDPGDHRPGPPVPPRYPRRAPAWSSRSPRPGECPALP